ncbi:NAD-dependent epimerase/dehydratase family protein [Salinimicrobium sp. TH3]|uniref:NAD-dependent epimerase/dehydratase family protein n=1 Tax=Salinimicrobium sp. TH3 TaxID=2997342 RepID=UPI0022769CD7|nr:NAD-dependent epimerase/dehydratase family protein [Salinimicrobium sp. TH3]MCY2686937.1 NAD-dependent epimerase/dehydratase family protein [Salinimicrobium sp. TH3]
MKKRIFITGISSKIILALIELIDLEEHEIFGLTRNPENLNLHPEINLIKGDITDYERIENLIKECDLIIHAAAVTHSFDKEKYFNVNLHATKKLVDLASTLDIGKFVFISSNTASEKSGAYGLTKFLAENYIADNLKNWLILRPSEIYGGDSKEGIEKFVSEITYKSIILYPTGVPSKFYPIHFEDVAEIIYNLVFEERITNEKITICGPTGYSFSDVISLTKNVNKRNTITIPVLKSWMFLIQGITEKLPFFVGVIPDQISRLYGPKNLGSTKFRLGQKSFEDYLTERLFRDIKIQ